MIPEHSRAVKSGDEVEIWLYSNPVYPKKAVVKKKRRSAPVRSVRSAKRAARMFAYIVRENLLYGSLPLMITLTYRPENEEREVKKAYKHYTRFIQKMRYRYGNFRVISVVEFQDKSREGVVHFHCLFWDLPEDIDRLHKKEYILEQQWRYGFVFTKQCYDTSEKIVSYLVKYLRKGHGDQRLAGSKAYSVSRNCHRPSMFKGNMQTSYLLDIYGIDFKDVSQAHRIFEYSTEWLGKVRYLKYRLSTVGELPFDVDACSIERSKGMSHNISSTERR